MGLIQKASPKIWGPLFEFFYGVIKCRILDNFRLCARMQHDIDNQKIALQTRILLTYDDVT